MTNRLIVDRSLPPCRCPAGCGGHPEFDVRLSPAYPAPPTTAPEPPEFPHSPVRRNDILFDTLNQRHGVVMDLCRTLVYLRPEHGGHEWDVDQKWLVKQ
ncbi:hypothetical protein ACFYNO_34210 [Kitasatospora sp. NPDC006697]|uniref:hypothetical protein n=1 Tax=Kitasatospora sp. NPDC006697 TaxID=3364020 RepID=UPI00367FEA10